jgi:hypothetical protein
MKIRKSSTLSVRLDPDTRAAFYRKAAQEQRHDPSSVLRTLIDLYLANIITIERTHPK